MRAVAVERRTVRAGVMVIAMGAVAGPLRSQALGWTGKFNRPWRHHEQPLQSPAQMSKDDERRRDREFLHDAWDGKPIPRP